MQLSHKNVRGTKITGFLAVGPRALVKRHCSELWSSLLIHIRRKKVKGRVQGERRVGLGFYIPLIRFPFWVFGFLWSVFFWYLLICFCCLPVGRFLLSPVFTLLVFIFCFRSCLPFFFFSVLHFSLSDSYFRCSVNLHTTTTTNEQIYRVSIPALISMSHLNHAIGTIA